MPKGFRLERFYFLIIFSMLFSFNLQAKDPAFSFNHPDCKLKVLLSKKDMFLQDTLEEMAKKRRFKMKLMKNQKDIFKGEMYLKVGVARIKHKLYDHCEVDLKLLLSREDRYTSTRDTTLYEQKNKRSLPRITLKGNERCHRAIKDAFIHIPTCLKR